MTGPFGSTVTALAVLAPVVLAASCALLVGDPDGHKVFSEADAQVLDSTTADAAEAGAGPADGQGVDVLDGDAGDAPTYDVASADGSPVDADGRAPEQIRCGQKNCPIQSASTVCCFTNPFDAASAECTSSSACLTPSLPFFCSTAADCAFQGHPGFACCGALAVVQVGDASGAALEGAQCVPKCANAGGPLPYVLCDPADTTSIDQCTDAGRSCIQFGAPPAGYYACQ